VPAAPVVPALPELPLPAAPVPPSADVTLPQPASNNIEPTDNEQIHPRMRIAGDLTEDLPPA
jgi:hypothetical protein